MKSADPLLITGAALLLFTTMFFQLGKEGFTAIPDEKLGGLGCPPNFEWTDETHTNCKRIIDGNSTWYETPVCPKELVHAFDECMKQDDALAKENGYYTSVSVLATVFAVGIIYLFPNLAPYVGLVVGMFVVMIIIIVFYIRINANPAFGSLKFSETTYEEYRFQFYIMLWIFATIFLFVGYMIGKFITS